VIERHPHAGRVGLHVAGFDVFVVQQAKTRLKLLPRLRQLEDEIPRQGFVETQRLPIGTRAQLARQEIEYPVGEALAQIMQNFVHRRLGGFRRVTQGTTMARLYCRLLSTG